MEPFKIRCGHFETLCRPMCRKQEYVNASRIGLMCNKIQVWLCGSPKGNSWSTSARFLIESRLTPNEQCRISTQTISLTSFTGPPRMPNRWQQWLILNYAFPPLCSSPSSCLLFSNPFSRLPFSCVLPSTPLRPFCSVSYPPFSSLPSHPLPKSSRSQGTSAVCSPTGSGAEPRPKTLFGALSQQKSWVL